MAESYEQSYYESDEFWKPGVFGETQRLRIEQTSALIPDDVSSLADIGCGNGALCNYLVEHKPNLQVMGIDRSQTALKYVKADHKQGDIAAIPLEDRSMDCVSCLQVLEHITVPDYENALKELARVSSKYLLISVPYKEKIHENVTKCPSCQSVFNYDLHLRSYDDDTMKHLFSAEGFEMIQAINIGGYEMPYVYEWYLKAISPKVKKANYLENFHSPICPICGYTNTNEIQKDTSPVIKKPAPIDQKSKGVKGVLRKSWLTVKPLLPTKKVEGYWIAALYQRT